MAFVKDVGILSRRLRGSNLADREIVVNGFDFLITESGFTLSRSGETLVIGGRDSTSISFEDVKLIRFKDLEKKLDWHILTVSTKGSRWWSKSRFCKIALRDWQFAQVVQALRSVPALEGRVEY